MTEPTDPTLLQLAGVAIMNVMVGAGAWFAGRRKNKAAEAVEVARLGVEETEARAENTVYKRLIERITRLEDSVRTLNHELDAERRQRRHVENHVGQLERMMRAAGLNPPELKPLASTG